MNDTERIELLKKAEELLMQAADLMDSALHMSGIEHRCPGASEEIRRIASDPSDGGSVANVRRDLEHRNIEEPCWTQPLTSPKNQRFV